MKRVFILFVVAFYSLQVLAQYKKFPLDSNHYWQERIFRTSTTPGDDINCGYYYKVQGDSVINGLTYKYIKTENIVCIVGSASYQTWLVREDTIRKLLLKYTASGERIIFNFNKSVGDTLVMPAGGTPITYTVSAIDSLLLGDGLYHRRFVYQASSNNDFAIEGVGGKGGLFQSYRFKGEVSSGLICHGTISPNSTIFSQGSAGGSCPDFTGITRHSSTDINFALYPNPSQAQLFVHCDEAQKINITNYSGETVLTAESSEGGTLIDISELAAGIYFVQILDNAKVQVKKLLIEK